MPIHIQALLVIWFINPDKLVMKDIRVLLNWFPEFTLEEH